MDYYEKKYNEALERAKQKIDAGFLTEDDLSYIFPELRKSEDAEEMEPAFRDGVCGKFIMREYYGG